jgi:hypothetical protein
MEMRLYHWAGMDQVWTNLSMQDKTWAEFSTLDMDVGYLLITFVVPGSV